MGNLVRGISDDGQVSVIAIDSTDIVQRAFEIHKTSHVCTAALGRLLSAAALMSSSMKDDNDSVTVKINGGGPCGTVTAVANSMGHVKGEIANPDADLPLKADGHLDVGGVVGTDGMITIIKDIGLSKPYIGQTPIVSGEIAEDVTAYYAYSEQVPTVCALGVLVAPDGNVIVAGGYLIQLLPFAEESTIEKVEHDIKNIASVTKMLCDGLSASDICSKVLQSFKIEELGRSNPVYRCDCSKQKVENALITVGKNELLKMAYDSITEVSCHFCDKIYRFSSAEIRQLADSIEK